ncbi:MAG: hypothetical protein IJZ53_06170 [Tyzzerella sp.]|nr:hypothetical protein [Tyzzerella sp.]
MGKQQVKILRKFIIGYVMVCVLCLGIVARTCSDNPDLMSYLGSFLGGILGGLATLIAIYFTLMSLKQDVMPHVFPMRTVLYGYYSKTKGIYVSAENIEEDMISINGEYVENHKVDFNPFNTSFMKFANVGKDSALNVRIEWSTPYDSELYDILLEYGIPHTYFDKHFNTQRQEKLYADYMLPIKIDPEGYRVQIIDELVEILRYIMSVFLGAFDEYAINEKTRVEFGNNFIKKKQKFATIKIAFDDLNGNTITKEYPIYCRLQRTIGRYNDGYEKMKIELSTFDIVN